MPVRNGATLKGDSKFYTFKSNSYFKKEVTILMSDLFPVKVDLSHFN